MDAFIGDFAAAGETEDLIAAAVRQNSPVPADKAMESAEPRDQLLAGAQVEMVGVRKHEDARRRRETSRCVSALIAPCVPTGMNTGVSTTACAVVSRPRRAPPSVARSSNERPMVWRYIRPHWQGEVLSAEC